jgi:hypothetical protein
MTLLRRIHRAIDNHLTCVVSEEKHVIVVPVTDNGVRHVVVIQVGEEAETITLIMKYDRKAPQSRREEMCVFMSTVNQMLLIGGLEMDLQDGECQFRHAVDVESITLNDRYLDRLVMTHCVLGARYWGMIETVMNGGDSRSAIQSLR